MLIVLLLIVIAWQAYRIAILNGVIEMAKAEVQRSRQTVYAARCEDFLDLEELKVRRCGINDEKTIAEMRKMWENIHAGK